MGQVYQTNGSGSVSALVYVGVNCVLIAVNGRNFVDYNRYERVNPNLSFKVPKLDEKNKVIDVLREARSEMEQNLRDPQGQICTIAQRLVASSFYLEVIEVQNRKATFVATAVIRCRFDDNSKEIRSLGDWLTHCQRNSFQPHFKVEKVQDSALTEMEISRDVIRKYVALPNTTLVYLSFQMRVTVLTPPPTA